MLTPTDSPPDLDAQTPGVPPLPSYVLRHLSAAAEMASRQAVGQHEDQAVEDDPNT